MPLDELSLNLTPPTARVPDLEVMTRTLRLPTASPRQARSIVKLQLDRLSPLPTSEIVFDLVSLKRDGAETVYALGLLRQSALKQSAFAARRIVQVSHLVDGQNVVFRFRNPGVVTNRETRWLAKAPRFALVTLGVVSVILAFSIRIEEWRDRRLPEIAAEQRLNTRQALAARQSQKAWGEWSSLERADAATRFLCVASLLSPDAVQVIAVTADATQVRMSPANEIASARLQTAGGAAAEGPLGLVTFGQDICS
jgi:hypothetical protein